VGFRSAGTFRRFFGWLLAFVFCGQSGRVSREAGSAWRSDWLRRYFTPLAIVPGRSRGGKSRLRASGEFRELLQQQQPPPPRVVRR